MKILHVVHGYPPEVIGGTELYVARLARAQKESGHDVHVCAGSLQWKPELTVRKDDDRGIPVTRIHREDLYFDRWDKGYHPGVALRFELLLGHLRPDVVHVHHWLRLTSNLVAIAARSRIPAVVTVHDLYPTCPRVFRLKGERGEDPCETPMGVDPCVPCVPRWRFQRDAEVADLVRAYRADMARELELAALVVAPSRSHGEFLRAMLGFSAARTRVVRHGSLATSGPPASSPVRGGMPERLHLAYWSHLAPLKGAHVLLEAAARARSREKVRVHLFGEAADPDYRERLEELARGADVCFHGGFRPDDLARATIDVAVLPTLCRESWSFILDEAARLGVPILASDAGALRDRATERVALFARNDADDLARWIDRMAGDAELLERMRAAPPPAVPSFTEHAAEIEQAYREARARELPPPPARDDAERLADQWRRREIAFQELVRIEKWEDIVEEQRRRIAELERLLSSPAPPNP